MKTKFSLLIFALLFVCSGMMAQDKITIGVIQYDLGDVDKSFKDLHDQGFGSCELNYQKNKFTKDFAEKVKAASKKHNIKVTTVVGVPGSHCVWNFRQGPATIGLVPKEERAEQRRAVSIADPRQRMLAGVCTYRGNSSEIPKSSEQLLRNA